MEQMRLLVSLYFLDYLPSTLCIFSISRSPAANGQDSSRNSMLGVFFSQGFCPFRIFFFSLFFSFQFGILFLSSFLSCLNFPCSLDLSKFFSSLPLIHCFLWLFLISSYSSSLCTNAFGPVNLLHAFGHHMVFHFGRSTSFYLIRNYEIFKRFEGFDL